MTHALKGHSKSLTITGLVLVAILTLAVATTWAQGGRRGGGDRAGGPGGIGASIVPGLRQIDLSDAQRDEIRSLVQSSREATRETAEQLRRVRRALNDAVTTDVVNEGAIRAVTTQLGLVEGDMAVLRAKLHAQVWQLLTPEQQTSAAQFAASAAERRQEGRDRRRERRLERRPAA